MVKTSRNNLKKRKNAPEKVSSVTKKMKQDTSISLMVNVPAANEDSMLGGLIYEDELETTTETLALLSKNPSLISLKALKPFKTAVYDYWRVAHEITNTGACILTIRELEHIFLTLSWVFIYRKFFDFKNIFCACRSATCRCACALG